MKKTLSAAALALCFGVGANAATPVFSSNLTGAKADISSERLSTLKDLSIKKSDVKKGHRAPNEFVKATSLDQFIGSYKYSFETLLQNEDGDPVSNFLPTSGTFTITQDEVYPDSVCVNFFTNFADTELIRGGFDAENGCLRIPPQYLFLNTYYNYEVWFYGVQWDLNEAGDKFTLNDKSINPLSLHLTTDDGLQMGAYLGEGTMGDLTDDMLSYGKIISPTLMMPKSPDGFFLLGLDFYATRQVPYEFIDAEWEEVGMGLYKDIYFPMAVNEGDELVWEVPILRHKTNWNLLALKQPYGPGTPFYEELWTVEKEPGHIILDWSDPLCVCLMSGVYTFTREYTDEQTQQLVSEDFYCFNAEGYLKYVQDSSYDEIIANLDGQKLEISWYKGGNRFEIFNPQFGLDMDFNAPFYWTGQTAEGYIDVPEAAISGVETVIGENIDAPAEYYTLQGVRVNNPAKGEIVIVRKGNKSYKTIAK